MTAARRFVALFRGINVGKAKRLAMADLRELLASLGCENVRTLLNSGNVVFDAPGTASAATLATRIRSAVAEQLGFDALLIVKPARDFAAAVAGNPLDRVADPSGLLVVFATDDMALQDLARFAGGAEPLHIGRHAAYLECVNGLMDSKLAVLLLRELGGSGTTRNWATVEKINALLGPA